jgi:hypothetical protein
MIGLILLGIMAGLGGVYDIRAGTKIEDGRWCADLDVGHASRLPVQAASRREFVWVWALLLLPTISKTFPSLRIYCL